MRARLADMGILDAASPKGAWGSDVTDELLERHPTYRVLKSHFSPFARRAVCWAPRVSSLLDEYLSAPASVDQQRIEQGLPTLLDLFEQAAPSGAVPDALRRGGVSGLNQLLITLGVDTLVVAGSATHVCLDATVSAASELGYRVIEPFDACGSEDPDKHWTYLHNHGAFRTELCTTDQFVQQIMR